MKKQPTDWEKIFANDVTKKGLITKIYNSSHNSTTSKNKQPSRKQADGLNSHFSKEYIQMNNRHMKRCSMLLIIREIQTKTTMNEVWCEVSHQSEQPSLKTSTNGGEDVEKRNIPALLVGMPIGTAIMECSMEVLHKTTNKSCHMIQQSHSWAYIQTKL